MDRALLEQRFAEAEQRVTLSDLCIAKMREIIAELERDVHDSTQAKEMLAAFLETQGTLVRNCDRLLARLKPKLS